MIRILRKDLQEFLATIPSAITFFIWPLLILIAIAPLKDGNQNISAYVESYELEALHPDRDLYAATLATRLADLPDVELVEEARGDRDVWEFMDAADADIALIWHDVLLPQDAPAASMQAAGAWYAYIDPRSSTRYRQIATVMEFAYGGAVAQDQISQAKALDAPTSGITLSALDAIVPNFDALLRQEGDASEYSQSYTKPVDADDADTKNKDAVVSPPIYLIERNGPAADNYSWLIPGVILIIANMIAFIFASSALVKEREASTIQLIVDHRHGFFTLLSKAVFPAFLGLISLLIMLLFVHSAVGFSIRPGWPSILAVVSCVNIYF